MLLSDAIRKRTSAQAPARPQRATPSGHAPVEQLVFFRHRQVPRGFTTSPLHFLRRATELEDEGSEQWGDYATLQDVVDPLSTGRAVAGAGLFHVTTNLPAVLAYGRLRSHDELKAANIAFAGLGSETSKGQVSVGVMRDGAIRLLKGIQLMADAVHGRIDGERALTVMNEVLEPAMAIVNYYAEQLKATGDSRGYMTVSEYADLTYKRAQAVRKAKPGVALYDALQDYENIITERFSSWNSGHNTDMSLAACAYPMIFLDSSTKFSSVNPDNVGLLQLAARKTAEPLALSEECELQFQPDELVIIGVWQARHHKSMPSRTRRSTVR